MEVTSNNKTFTMFELNNMTNLTSEGNMSSLTNSTFFTRPGATIASPIIMCLAGVLGNILALIILHRTRLESQRLMFHSLVAGLVWNDLIGIILTTPVTVASYINDMKGCTWATRHMAEQGPQDTGLLTFPVHRTHGPQDTWLNRDPKIQGFLRSQCTGHMGYKRHDCIGTPRHRASYVPSTQETWATRHMTA
ncbi:Prostaglandin E2 receptor EP4 subtype [Bulinus truncatus]|nr:Prostaglandin E2 receptor EP4 subtype [Bulinus truncatus]